LINNNWRDRIKIRKRNIIEFLILWKEPNECWLVVEDVVFALIDSNDPKQWIKKTKPA